MKTLHSCLDDSKEAILAGNTDQAIDLCFHVLSSFPKCIDAHCLLGEAYREKGLTKQAEKAFRRVLSADPENLMARWALSIMEEEKGDKEMAVFELRRAFELNSGHPELRQELARRSQGQFSLTRGALGRLYARGEIFDRAAVEFRAVLAVDPGRLDILVALAEALWRNRQYDDAKTVCQQILTDSPDCLKANIILGYIFYLSGDHQQAENFFERAEALDPENTVAEQLTEEMDVDILLPAVEIEIADLEEIDMRPADKTGAADESIDSRGVIPSFGDEDSDQADASSSESLDHDLSVPAVDEPMEVNIAREKSESPDWHELLVVADKSEDEAEAVAESQEQELEAAAVADDLEQAGEVNAIEENVEVENDEGTEEIDTDEEDVEEDEEDEDIDEDAQEEVVAEEGIDAEDEEIEEQDGVGVLSILGCPGSNGTAGEALVIEAQWRKDAENEEIEQVAEALVPNGNAKKNGVAKIQKVLVEANAGAQDEEQFASTRADYILACQQKLQSKPTDSLTRLNLARAYYEVAQIDQAVTEFEIIMKASPNLIDRVIEGLKAITVTHPDHLQANRRLGDAYMKIGRFQDAIDCYNRCLSKQKSASPARR